MYLAEVKNLSALSPLFSPRWPKSQGIDRLHLPLPPDLQEMHESKTIKVPEPIAVGTSDNNAFVVFEYLAMGGSRGGRIGELMGKVSLRMLTWAVFLDVNDNGSRHANGCSNSL